MAPYAARRLGIDDVGFTRALIAFFRSRSNADTRRVFATGVSNGGQMAIRLALEAPELVRAVAPVVASLPAAVNMDCRVSGVPVSIMFMNGTDDPMNPYGGGDVELYGLWGNRGRVVSSIASATWFARLAGYTGPPERAMLPDRNRHDGSTVERLQWDDPKRRRITLYSIRGGGHTVPHPTARAPRLLGRTNADLAAAEEIWSFFAGEAAKTEEKGQ
jgi:polyhydroxybutyrate depolymerase